MFNTKKWFYHNKELLFILFFGAYLSMVLIEGFLWKGVFWKHMKLKPEFLLTVSFLLWFSINKDYIMGRLKFSKFYLFFKKVVFLFLPFFIIASVLMSIYKTEEVRLLVLDKYKFHWFWLVESMFQITISLFFFTLLDPVLLKKIGYDFKIGSKGNFFVFVNKDNVIAEPVKYIFLIMIVMLILIAGKGATVSYFAILMISIYIIELFKLING